MKNEKFITLFLAGPCLDQVEIYFTLSEAQQSNLSIWTVKSLSDGRWVEEPKPLN